jgi:hypothetical protein
VSASDIVRVIDKYVRVPVWKSSPFDRAQFHGICFAFASFTREEVLVTHNNKQTFLTREKKNKTSRAFAGHDDNNNNNNKEDSHLPGSFARTSLAIFSISGQ